MLIHRQVIVNQASEFENKSNSFSEKLMKPFLKSNSGFPNQEDDFFFLCCMLSHLIFVYYNIRGMAW